MEEKYLKSVLDLLEPKSRISSLSVKLAASTLILGIGILLLIKAGFLSANAGLLLFGFIAGGAGAKAESYYGMYNFLAPYIDKYAIKEKLERKV